MIFLEYKCYIRSIFFQFRVATCTSTGTRVRRHTLNNFLPVVNPGSGATRNGSRDGGATNGGKTKEEEATTRERERQGRGRAPRLRGFSSAHSISLPTPPSTTTKDLCRRCAALSLRLPSRRPHAPSPTVRIWHDDIPQEEEEESDERRGVHPPQLTLSLDDLESDQRQDTLRPSSTATIQ